MLYPSIKKKSIALHLAIISHECKSKNYFMNDLSLHVLASSSSGNCALLRANGMNILVDAGISASRIRKDIANLGLTLNDIDGIFITHEHGDHCYALETLSKHPNMRVFACEETFEFITYRKPATKSLQWTVFKSGQSFSFGEISVTTYTVPHDVATVAYKFNTGEKSFVWLTDLGKPTILAKELAKEAHVLVLEANYCPKMLQNSSRPQQLKNRISGNYGHLSNADAIAILEGINPSFVERILLAHVSKECNNLDHIAELLSGLPQELKSKIEIICPFSGIPQPLQ